MKPDVEYQGDNARATFYYTAENRVDFRDLVRELASTFDIGLTCDKSELARKLLALEAWACAIGSLLHVVAQGFRSVSTDAARYQQLFESGQVGETMWKIEMLPQLSWINT